MSSWKLATREVPLNRSDSTAYDYLGTDDKGIKDLKKKDLSSVAGISQSSVAKMSRGEPVNLETILKICAAFNCDIGDVCEAVPEKLTE